MIQAARDGSLEDLKTLLQDDNVGINGTDEDGLTALMRTCKKGHDDIAQFLLSNGANIEERQSHVKRTALMFACEHGHLSTAKLLLDSGANIEAKDRACQRPLHLAAYKGHEDMVKLLLTRGAKINALCKNEGTPLHYACYHGEAKCIEELVRQGADIGQKNSKGKTPFEIKQVKNILKDRKKLFHVLDICKEESELKDELVKHCLSEVSVLINKRLASHVQALEGNDRQAKLCEKVPKLENTISDIHRTFPSELTKVKSFCSSKLNEMLMKINPKIQAIEEKYDKCLEGIRIQERIQVDVENFLNNEKVSALDEEMKRDKQIYQIKKANKAMGNRAKELTNLSKESEQMQKLKPDSRSLLKETYVNSKERQ